MNDDRGPRASKVLVSVVHDILAYQQHAFVIMWSITLSSILQRYCDACMHVRVYFLQRCRFQYLKTVVYMIKIAFLSRLVHAMH